MTALLQTLAAEVAVEGVGLHTGAPVRVLLRPRAEPGILFARSDLPGAPLIAAAPRSIARTVHATTLEENGVSLSTTEHLLAALWALGVTNCRVEVDGPEIPILDGSAAPWCRAVRRAGLEPSPEYSARPLYALREPVWVEDGASSMLGLPHPALRLSVAVDFGLPYAGRQVVDCVVTAESFEAELAAARTFTRAEWLEPLRAQGLIRGGSLDNAIVLEQAGPSSPWRINNELARHKALDVVGDLALLFAADGGVLCAHLIAVKAGHPLHQRWMEQCLKQDALLRCSS
jgi:UDP-3-O-[3-hydroxymyristoyl] N-acetylglucosamine deacetylase